MIPLLVWLAPIFVSAALLVIFVTAATNARTFPRLRVPSQAEPGSGGPTAPAVSILIPARNEAAVIGQTLASLFAQDYGPLQVILLNDHSDDATEQVALAAAAAAAERAPGSAPDFRLLCGQPLPRGWMGKNWACHQLAAAASTDLLVFADADVRWEPGAVRALVAELARSEADLLTVWPTQTTVSWGERLSVPLMALAVLGYLPLRLAHDFYHPLAAAANGQCMAFRREAYAAAGGHAAVRGFVVEDVRLAQRIKACGRKLRMADGNKLIRCRMYDGWAAAVDGYAKNILAGHGGHVSLLLLSTLFHWAVFVWPWLWLALGANTLLPFWPLWPLLLVALGVGARALTAGATHQRGGDALLMPLSVLLMTYVALRAIWWRWRFGGVVWKGRILRDA
jgi:chlorobactene glucosyltransferase